MCSVRIFGHAGFWRDAAFELKGEHVNVDREIGKTS